MKAIHRLQLSFLCLLSLWLTACSEKRPDTILSDDRMADVLYDYHIAKAMGDELPYNEAYKRVLYVESVYKKHGITKADFDSSMVWFTRHPEALCDVYSIINLRMNSEKKMLDELVALRENKPKATLPGDSINIWSGKRSYMLTGMPLDNKLTFVIPSDTNFRERDTLRWNISYRYSRHLPDSLYAPTMALQLLFENDSVLTASECLDSVGWKSLSLSSDTLGLIKEVRGFLYYPQQGDVDRVLLIDSIALMRYHATDTLQVAKKQKTEEQESVEEKEEPAKAVPVLKEEPKQEPSVSTNRSNPRIREVSRPRPVQQTATEKPVVQRQQTAPKNLSKDRKLLGKPLKSENRRVPLKQNNLQVKEKR